jgi:two-component SAPR family response regulator
VTDAPAPCEVQWTDKDMELLELLLEQAARELASRKVMAGIWAARAAERGDAAGVQFIADA